MSDQAVYIFSQSVCALIEAIGMLAAEPYNHPGERNEVKQNFMRLIAKYGLDNSVIAKLREGK